MMKHILFLATAALLAAGCAGETTQLHMRDAGAKEEKVVLFPNGTMFGGASKEQASELARLFVESHNMSLKEMDEMEAAIDTALKNQDAMSAEMKRSSQRSDEAFRKLMEAAEQHSQQHTETAQQTMRMIEQLAKQQGTGEITLFFPLGSSKIGKESMEFERLIGFVDYLSRESKGRTLILISIGSASAVGDKKTNMKLAKGRSEFPLDVIDKYLVNVPHEFFKVYGTGDMYSPKEASSKEHERYQHVRIIAVFEESQLPGLPAEPSGN